ncbi:hypothetical protein T4D_1939 [Trichinella pseudospiralis]|uniref:Uncharacterized protein n=1 Tax=Trichinella pseudospiralis TaxID=6337 RepID=A0A0V1G6C0_TRIPS|nr:hypothetical protein T4D_1939 [Trichinella pseudospiralis]
MKRSLDGMCLRSRLIDLPLLLLGEGTDCSGTSADGLVSEVARLDCDDMKFDILNAPQSHVSVTLYPLRRLYCRIVQ